MMMMMMMMMMQIRGKREIFIEFLMDAGDFY